MCLGLAREAPLFFETPRFHDPLEPSRPLLTARKVSGSRDDRSRGDLFAQRPISRDFLRSRQWDHAPEIRPNGCARLRRARGAAGYFTHQPSFPEAVVTGGVSTPRALVKTEPYMPLRRLADKLVRASVGSWGVCAS